MEPLPALVQEMLGIRCWNERVSALDGGTQHNMAFRRVFWCQDSTRVHAHLSDSWAVRILFILRTKGVRRRADETMGAREGEK